MIGNALVWYRGDLRTIDHHPLVDACQYETVTCVYCFDPRQFEKTSFGFDRTGPHRARFLLQSVEDLRTKLRELGGDLIVRIDRPENAIAALIEELNIHAVLAHREVGWEERHIEQRVMERCERAHVAVRWSQGQTLLHPDDLPFKIADLPKVFTPFRNKVEKKFTVRKPVDAPEKIRGGRLGELDRGALPTLGELTGCDADDLAAPIMRGGQTAGMERLKQYIWDRDRLRIYKETRNGMLNFDDSSKLSAWLACGCLSPRTVHAEVLRYESQRIQNDSTYWLIFELLWRDYFQFISLKHGAAMFQLGGLRGVELQWKEGGEVLERWIAGQTGFPIIDANMREIAATGYMSNRGRQNVANFLTTSLGIDWRMGAEYFESVLIDYDVASNYGNWLYTAGVGNDPRGSRFFNPIKQSVMYDPEGDYVRHWCPELADVPTRFVHQPWKSRVDYPKPIVEPPEWD